MQKFVFVTLLATNLEKKRYEEREKKKFRATIKFISKK